MHRLRSRAVRHVAMAVALAGMLLPLTSLAANAAAPVVDPSTVSPLSATNISGATHTWTFTCGAAGDTAVITLEGPNGTNVTSAMSETNSAGVTVTAPGFSSSGAFDITCTAAGATVKFTITQNTPGTYYFHAAETAAAGTVFPVTAAGECADEATNDGDADDALLPAPTGATSTTCELTAIKQYAQLTNVFLFPAHAQNFGFYSEPLKTYIFPSHTVILIAIGEVPVKAGATCTGTGIFNPATGQFQPAHLQANAVAGSTSIFVNAGLNIFFGDVLTINAGAQNQESVVVTSYNASTGQVTLAAPLANNHAAGEPVTTGLVEINGECFEYVGVAGAPYFITLSGTAAASFTPSTACDIATGDCPASSPTTNVTFGVTGPGGIAAATLYGGQPGTAYITGSVYTPNCTFSDVTKCPTIATATVTKTFSIQEGSTVPLVKWAGEKVVLQKYFGINYAGYPVTFSKSTNVTSGNGNAGRFVAAPAGGTVTDDTANTFVAADGVARVLAESDGPGEMIATASLGTPASPNSVINEHQFSVYFLKFEDVTLGNVVPQSVTLSSGLGFLGYLPGIGYAAGYTPTLSVTLPWGSTATDVTTATVNVCANELLRARVRGWFVSQDQSTRPARAVPTGTASTSVEELPAGRWVLPDDWPALAVGSAGLGAIGGSTTFPNFRPQWDLNGGWAFDQTEGLIAGVTPTGPFYSVDSFGTFYATSGPCVIGPGYSIGTGIYGTPTLFYTPPGSTSTLPIPVPNNVSTQNTFGLDPTEPFDVSCVYSPIANYPHLAGSNSNGTTYSTSPAVGGPYACDVASTVAGLASPCETGAGTVGPFDPLRSYTDPSEARLGGSGLLGAPYADSPTYGSSYLPNGTLSQYDAPMPPAKIAFLITNPSQSCEKVQVGNSTFAQSATDFFTGAALNFNLQGACPSGQRLAAAMPGYFIPADKSLIYRLAVSSNISAAGKPDYYLYVNPFYYEFIPDNPLIPPHANGQGYDYNSFGGETNTSILGCGLSGGAPNTVPGSSCHGDNYILVSIAATPCAYTSGPVNSNGTTPVTCPSNGGLGGSIIVNTNILGLTANTGQSIGIDASEANCPAFNTLPAGTVCISLSGTLDGGAIPAFVGATVTVGLAEQAGEAQGPYHFWDFVNVDFSSLNASIGYTPIQDQPKEVEVYSDNHGEAMVYLTGLSSDISLVKFLNGLGGVDFPAGATLGATTVEAIADYPYFRFFPPVASNVVTKTWTSAFAKTLTIGAKGLNGIALPAPKQLATATLTDVCGNPIVGEPVVFSVIGPAIIVPTTVVSGTQPVFNGTDTQATVTSDNTGTAAVVVEATGSATVVAFFPQEGLQRTAPIGPSVSTVIPVSYAAGWNMVGGPAGTSFAPSQVMYSWNGAAYAAVPTRTTSMCTGYFAYFASTTSVNIQAPATSAGTTQSCSLTAGWNLVGNPFTIGAALPSGATAYYYNPTSGSYGTVTTIPAGGAVWVYEGAAANMTLTATS